MNTKKFLPLFISLFILFSCNFSKTKIISDKVYAGYQKKGEGITNLAQAILLGNVSKAMQQGGPEYAVEFCNLKASLIMDSLNSSNQCIISRVSDKNRNPDNKIGLQLMVL